MFKINCVLLLLLLAVSAKQEDLKSSSSKTTKNDQEVSNDRVTSILVQPGPDGPRHVILSNDHQVISSSPQTSAMEGVSSRAVKTNYNFPLAYYHYQPGEGSFHQTIPPPLTQVTYGPAQPVAFRHARPVQQLYHHRFHQGGKIPHTKAPQQEAIYKYSTYIKHDKVKEVEKDLEKGYYSSNYEKPDYTVTAEKGSHSEPQHEGLSKYRNRDEEEEIKFRESIGDLYSHDSFDKSSEYEEKKPGPLPYSKFYIKQNTYEPNNVDYVPNKNHLTSLNTFDNDAYYNNAPSGFDDYNGGKVVPVLAKFYKQPLPIIHTQLPADNLGLFIQYFHPERSGYEKAEEEVSNNYFDQYQGKLSLKRDSPSSEWTPINAPNGAVPAKAYDIPAPDLSLDKPVKVYRRGSDSASVVVGKSKQKIATSSQHIQGNSEGVVSAVVRVKQ